MQLTQKHTHLEIHILCGTHIIWNPLEHAQTMLLIFSIVGLPDLHVYLYILVSMFQLSFTLLFQEQLLL